MGRDVEVPFNVAVDLVRSEQRTQVEKVEKVMWYAGWVVRDWRRDWAVVFS